MNKLKTRGLNDILIAVVDGLKRFPDAVTAVYPDAVVQTCIVPLIRHSLQLASWKDRKALAQALKPNYQADTVEATEKALSAFENSPWRQRFPTIAQSWRRHWEHIIPLFPFAAPVRKIIWLALRNITAKWENPPIAWATAKAQFAIKFDERFRFDD